MAVLRYKKQLQKAPNFIELLAEAFNAKVASAAAATPEERLALSNHLNQAYKVSVCVSWMYLQLKNLYKLGRGTNTVSQKSSEESVTNAVPILQL